MLDSIVIVFLIGVIIGKIAWDKGRKKGREEGNKESHNEGFRNGIEKIENEVLELSKLPNKEILKRIKNFAKEKENE